jgi:hypothetical protein
MKFNFFIQKCEYSSKKEWYHPRISYNSIISSSKEGLIYHMRKKLYCFLSKILPKTNPYKRDIFWCWPPLPAPVNREVRKSRPNLSLTNQMNRINSTALTPKISWLFWWIMDPEICTYWHVGQWSKWTWYFSTSNCKTLYLTMLLDCRKNLNQSDLMDCKIITIEGEKKTYMFEFDNE